MRWSTEARATHWPRARRALTAALLLAVAVGSSAADVNPRGANPKGATAAAAVATAATAAASAACDELCFNATTLQGARDHLVLINIDAIGNTPHGPAHLTADRAEASGADFANNHWSFTGHVHVDMPEGQLQANAATVQFLDKHIVSIMANGTPAQFERSPQPAAKGNPGSPGAAPTAGAGAGATAADLTVHGHANVITYDLAKAEVQLTGDSWFTDGCNEITSQRITYNIAKQSVQANAEPGSNARVHGTIRNTRPGTACSPEAAHP